MLCSVFFIPICVATHTLVVRRVALGGGGTPLLRRFRMMFLQLLKKSLYTLVMICELALSICFSSSASCRAAYLSTISIISSMSCLWRTEFRKSVKKTHTLWIASWTRSSADIVLNLRALGIYYVQSFICLSFLRYAPWLTKKHLLLCCLRVLALLWVYFVLCFTFIAKRQG